jgi:hypothetical protein
MTPGVLPRANIILILFSFISPRGKERDIGEDVCPKGLVVQGICLAKAGIG